MSGLTVAIGVIVAVVWASSMGAQIATHGSYSTPLEVHGLMGTIVGALYTHERIRRNRNDDRDDR